MLCMLYIAARKLLTTSNIETTFWPGDKISHEQEDRLYRNSYHVYKNIIVVFIGFISSVFELPKS